MNKYLIFSILMFSEFLFSQTKIDENITVDFLNKPESFENVTKEAKLNVYYLNSKEESYVAMRVETLSNNELPKNIKELQKNYTILASEQLKSMAKKGLFLKDSTQIKLNGYVAYKLIFKEKNSEKESGESLIFYLNGITYVFIYSKVGSYNQINKEKFFKSIKINNHENLKQINESIDEPYNYWSALGKILLGGIFIFLALKLIKIEKKRNLIK